MNDVVYRQAAIDAAKDWYDGLICGSFRGLEKRLKALPSAQPERLTDDDFETIRIHLNAYKEKLCNLHRWEEAEEYQRIINRFMSFASAQPTIEQERKTGEWIGMEYDGYADGNYVYYEWKCSKCGCVIEEEGRPTYNYCPQCGADMRGNENE